jgi:hypothetical protein
MHLLAYFRVARPFAARFDFQTEGNVFKHGHVVEQSVVLEYESDVSIANRPQGRVAAVEQHLSFVRRLETGNDAQQRRLAASRGTEQRDQCARRYVQIDVFDGGEFAELLGYAA